MEQVENCPTCMDELCDATCKSTAPNYSLQVDTMAAEAPL